jgi:outer membrane autotransporter protein
MKSKFFRSSIHALRFLTITFPVAAHAAELTVPTDDYQGTSLTDVRLTNSVASSAALVVPRGATLTLNGGGITLHGGDLEIQGGGVIGKGFITADVLNNGLLSPGDPTANAFSKLVINGDYTQTEGTLRIFTRSATEMGKLVVHGDVKLGGTLMFFSNRLPSHLEFGQHYRLLESTGTITGDFDHYTLYLFAGFRKVIEVGQHSVDFIGAPDSYTQVATTRNETDLAQALDHWIFSADSEKREVVSALDNLTTPEYHAAFASISPALYESALSTAVEQTQNQLSALGNHLASRELRNDASPETKHDVWALSTGVYADGSLSSVEGDDFNSGGFLTGIDMQVARDFTAGLFTGSSESEGNFPGKNKIETDRYLLGGYATYSHDGFYANSALGGGFVDTEVKRTIQIGGFSQRTHSDTDGQEFFTMLNGGYDLHHGNWTFGPSGGLQYSNTQYDTIHERGAGPLDLKISNAESDSLRGKLGGRVAYYHKVSDQLTLIPESRLFWQHEFLRDNDSLDATLNNGAGSSFSHGVSDSDGDSFLGGVGVGFQTNFGFYGNVSYDVELGRENDAIHSLSVSADWKF